jgi:MFS family permease
MLGVALGACSCLYSPVSAELRGIGMAIFSSAPFLGPSLGREAFALQPTVVEHGVSTGPIVGGFLGEAAGFRWVFGLVAILSLLLTIIGALTLPETYAPVLLRERAARLQAATGKVYRSVYEKDKKVIVNELFRTSLTRPWKVRR